MHAPALHGSNLTLRRRGRLRSTVQINPRRRGRLRFTVRLTLAGRGAPFKMPTIAGIAKIRIGALREQHCFGKEFAQFFSSSAPKEREIFYNLRNVYLSEWTSKSVRQTGQMNNSSRN